MTLQQLKYAIAVADNGSMNEAAKKLFISQPSLSGMIKELEEEVDMQIFLRSNRGILITPGGEEFLGYARQVVEQYRLMEDRFVEKKVKKNFSVSAQHYTFAVKAFVELVIRSAWMSMSSQSTRQRRMTSYRRSRALRVSSAFSISMILMKKSWKSCCMRTAWILWSCFRVRPVCTSGPDIRWRSRRVFPWRS